MTFAGVLRGLPRRELQNRLESATPADVTRALGRDTLDTADIAALLSTSGGVLLDDLVRRAAHVTRRRHGRVIQLYAPLYISNECVNRCAYCGFAQHLPVARASLTRDQTLREADILHGQGFRHLLLVSGEAPAVVTPESLAALALALRPRFDSVSIETAPFTRDGYDRLAAAGVDGMALYQETYLPEPYASFHPAGPKRRFDARLDAMDHAGEAGFWSLGIGALLGLTPWRLEALLLALHGRHLRRRFWQSRLSISFPRIRAAAGAFAPPHPVADRELAQMIAVMRLAFPDADLVLSTRERAALRDALLHVGITRFSAGSKTNPGGYADDGTPATGQFNVEDDRTPDAVAAMLRAQGFEPVWKDFDRGFVAA